MLTFSKIGRKGNLGNQLFQIASTIGLASDLGVDYGFKKWQYQQYFKNRLPIIDTDTIDFQHEDEKLYEHHKWNLSIDTDYDLEGWLQTENYFDVAKTKHYFKFSDEVVEKVKNNYKEAFTKETILLSIRRGDFVNHPDYFQTPIQFFINALCSHFPDWLTTKNLIICSDDLNYSKFHFSFLENAFFGENLSAVEQLCLGSLCDHFIISNSTFSWWSAWLGEKECSKIIRPLQNFRGAKAKELNDKDYFPKRWLPYDFENKRIKLNNLVVEKAEIDTSLKDYLNAFFEFNSVVNETNKKQLLQDKPYIAPPLLYYYTATKNVESIQLKPNTSVFKIAKTFNYQEFIDNNYDFGFFSSIFKFQNTPLINNRANRTNSDYLNVPVGLFVIFGGYKFGLKRYRTEQVKALKRTIKRILFR
ncbi:hypothetical protein NBRC110019_10910 [Neptunitalea chrysea]|uniref:Glycosyl transferase family 11 n=1 Tax=Neptunitalea chrysea TaxID=1647581 RepID=A0A9W6B551_9FLAO|nr:alpha-1,2-fucosyltransferase [Neptunitalea chrysea]GLB52052.1 hypothetical protein NBRC110019_10910 [Neptunitalea chrysea]